MVLTLTTVIIISPSPFKFSKNLPLTYKISKIISPIFKIGKISSPVLNIVKECAFINLKIVTN